MNLQRLESRFAPALTVASVTIADGTAQRSMVRELAVEFSEPATVDKPIGIHVTRVGFGPPAGFGAPYTVWPGDTAIAIHRPTPTTMRLTFAPLIDGHWDLTIEHAAIVDGAGQPLDGNGDGSTLPGFTVPGWFPENTFNRGFHRLAGDFNGDLVVDTLDYALLRAALNAESAPDLIGFDMDADGDLDAADVAAFRRCFGNQLVIQP